MKVLYVGCPVRVVAPGPHIGKETIITRALISKYLQPGRTMWLTSVPSDLPGRFMHGFDEDLEPILPPGLLESIAAEELDNETVRGCEVK